MANLAEKMASSGALAMPVQSIEVHAVHLRDVFQQSGKLIFNPNQDFGCVEGHPENHAENGD